jgi:GH15 family glucan-1,4-alpha-glucosidase
MTDLVRRSIEIILANQVPSGAYIASPNFPAYQYCWFRDGAYTAYAMDRLGEHHSAHRFHEWAARVINAREAKIEHAIDKANGGQPLSGTDILHTRYKYDGQDGLEEEWPNFQLDGFGTWLWSMGEHQRLSEAPLPRSWLKAAQLTAEYLSALWRLPCFDCWEEYPELVHTSTLAAIYGGLHAETSFSSEGRESTLSEIQTYLKQNAIADGYFIKAPGRQDVDASLVSLSTPYRVVHPQDERMRRTITRIEQTLRQGGVHRYPSDTYYGGGEWLLLSAWLGWYYADTGEFGLAQDLLAWVEGQASPDGGLPEQVPEALIHPPSYSIWLERWGPVANPLLWSHAMYLILFQALSDTG